MISTAPNRLFLRGQFRPCHAPQRRLRAGIILSSVTLCVVISIILSAVTPPKYTTRIVLDTGTPGCEHGMVIGVDPCADCIPFSAKLHQRARHLASDLKRALD